MGRLRMERFRMPAEKRENRKRKSQAALEYVAILAVLLIALIPLLYFEYNDLSSKNALAQAKGVVQQIGSTVNQLRAQGQGSRLVIQVQMPSGVKNASLNGREVYLQVATPSGGLTDVYSFTNANLTGSLPNVTGVYFINITVLDNGMVSVTPSS